MTACGVFEFQIKRISDLIAPFSKSNMKEFSVNQRIKFILECRNKRKLHPKVDEFIDRLNFDEYYLVDLPDMYKKLQLLKDISVGDFVQMPDEFMPYSYQEIEFLEWMVSDLGLEYDKEYEENRYYGGGE